MAVTLVLTACQDSGASYGGSSGVAEGTSSSETMTSTEPTGEPTSEPTGEPTAGSMSASGSETETAGTSTTTGGGCTESSECVDPASPICVDEACVACSDDEECQAKSPAAPACSDDGRCVACTPSNAGACEGETPVCNAVNECEGCAFHEQCVGTACDIATGACFSEDCVVDVDGDGGADYMNIQTALVDGCVVLVHELDGGDTYSQFEADGIKVAILAAAGEDPIVVGLAGNPSLRITNDAVAYVQGLTFTDSDVEGIVADGATVYLDRTSVVGNTGGGMVLTNGADGYLRNCFVGGDVSDVAALEATGSSVDILYTTLGGGFGSAAALRCNIAATVNVRNSLLVARTDDPEVDCATDSLVTSATEADLGDMNPNWFVVGGFANGNFHLSASAPPDILSSAQWQAGDPAADIDGDARPTEDGTADVAGADVP